MKYYQEIVLKNGAAALLRNAEASDGAAVYKVFNTAHEQTDYLLTYPDENSFTEEEEAKFLQKKTESPNEIEIIAVIGSKVVGSAGIEAVGDKFKLKHRADFGICILEEYWGLGLGRALTEACIQCAREAGYYQLELNVVAENSRAISLYKSVGFEEFGRNPAGFNSRVSGFQELVCMLRKL